MHELLLGDTCSPVDVRACDAIRDGRQQVSPPLTLVVIAHPMSLHKYGMHQQ